MPQKLGQSKRSQDDQQSFDMMLPNIPLLCLGCSVLVILDLQYIGRFWTQFEAWLSMQRASASGLVPDAVRSRVSVSCIYNASFETESQLFALWASKSVQEAHGALASPDVFVTNQKDKEEQLPKVKLIDQKVRSIWSQHPELFASMSAAAASQPVNGGPSVSTISSSLPILSFDCFLSHDWGIDGAGRSNHDRVVAIGNGLKRAGLTPWLDEERMRGDIHKQITDSIGTSTCIVVFLTDRYLRKASGTGPNGHDDFW